MSASTVSGVEAGRQISVFLENKPGTLGEVLRLLADGAVNVSALSLAEGLEHGYVRLVADRHDDAAALLREAGQLVLERDVVLLQLANAAGSLADVAARVASAGVNIEYAYCATAPSADAGLVVLKVDRQEAALSALRA